MAVEEVIYDLVPASKRGQIRRGKGPRSKASDKAAKDEEEAARGIRESQKYSEKYYFGRLTFPIGQLVAPERDLASRPLDLKHVNELAAGFQRTGTYDETISGLCRSNELAQKLVQK